MALVCAYGGGGPDSLSDARHAKIVPKQLVFHQGGSAKSAPPDNSNYHKTSLEQARELKAGRQCWIGRKSMFSGNQVISPGTFVQIEDFVGLVLENPVQLKVLVLNANGTLGTRLYKAGSALDLIGVKQDRLHGVLRLLSGLLAQQPEELSQGLKTFAQREVWGMLSGAPEASLEDTVLFCLHPEVLGMLARANLKIAKNRALAALLYLGSGDCLKEQKAQYFEMVCADPPIELPVAIFTDNILSKTDVIKALQAYRDHYGILAGVEVPRIPPEGTAQTMFPLLARCLGGKPHISTDGFVRNDSVVEFARRMLALWHCGGNPTTGLIAAAGNWLAGTTEGLGPDATASILKTPLAATILKNSTDKCHRSRLLSSAAIEMSSILAKDMRWPKQYSKAVAELGGLICLVDWKPCNEGLNALRRLSAIAAPRWVPFALQLVQHDVSNWDAVHKRIAADLRSKGATKWLQVLRETVTVDAVARAWSSGDLDIEEKREIAAWLHLAGDKEASSGWLLEAAHLGTAVKVSAITAMMGLGGGLISKKAAQDIGSMLLNQLSDAVSKAPDSPGSLAVEQFLRNNIASFSALVPDPNVSGMVVALAVRGATPNIWADLLIRLFAEHPNTDNLAELLLGKLIPQADASGARYPQDDILDWASRRLKTALARTSSELRKAVILREREESSCFQRDKAQLLSAIDDAARGAPDAAASNSFLRRTLEQLEYSPLSYGKELDDDNGLPQDLSGFIGFCRALSLDFCRFRGLPSQVGGYSLCQIAAAISKELELLERNVSSAKQLSDNCPGEGRFQRIRKALCSLGLFPVAAPLGLCLTRDEVDFARHQIQPASCTRWRVVAGGLKSAAGDIFQKAVLVPEE